MGSPSYQTEQQISYPNIKDLQLIEKSEYAISGRFLLEIILRKGLECGRQQQQQ